MTAAEIMLERINVKHDAFLAKHAARVGSQA
jgi:hypothetical protein